ncbi:MAG: hypothetical protein HQ553_05380 [Chloroflexi bacterium]|nr:hypothetical protein [Chloroflexota bacterium]
MSQQELLKRVVQTLDDSGIQYMLTGSVVSSLQGEPRSTHDIDIIVAIEQASALDLVEAFASADYYLSQESILDAIIHRGMFNLIDVNTGDKVDFWILTDEPFDCSRFERKYTEKVMGLQIAVSSPEDTILAKLNWAKLSGGSEKQFIDALRVFEVQFEKLDLTYLGLWAQELGVEQMLDKLQDEAETL